MQEHQDHLRITAAEIRYVWGRAELYVTLSDETEVHAFGWYADELTFTEQQFVGLSLAEARTLRHNRDVAYLRS